MNIDGDNFPERVVTVAGPDVNAIVGIMSDIIDNIVADFAHEPLDKRPPRVMGKGVRRFKDEDFQICLLLWEQDCIACIGRGGARIKQLQDNTHCSISVHSDFENGRTTLPGSNERIMTITGEPVHLPGALQAILEVIVETASNNRPIESWAMEITGPCNFFGDDATWPNQNSGASSMNHFGMGKTIHSGGMGGHMTGQMGQPIPGIDPMLETLEIERQQDGSVKFMANFDRSGSIMGNGGHRIKEIRKMSGAFINIDDPAHDSTLREITVARGQGNEMSVDNAVWLMNIAINAFCDPSGSACPFPMSTSMQDVVMSGHYGKPPGMQGQVQAQGFAGQQNFGGQQQQFGGQNGGAAWGQQGQAQYGGW